MLLLGSAQFSKKIGDGPINMAPFKKQCEQTHELINMNHNRYSRLDKRVTKLLPWVFLRLSFMV